MRKIDFETDILRRLDLLEPEIKAAAAVHDVDTEFFSRRLIGGIWEDRMKNRRSEDCLRPECGAEQVRRHLVSLGYPADTIFQQGNTIALENASYQLRCNGSDMVADVMDCWAWSFSSGSPVVKMDATDFANFLMQFDKAVPEMRKAMALFVPKVCKAYGK